MFKRQKFISLFFFIYTLFSGVCLADNYDFGTAAVETLPLETEKSMGEYFIKVARSSLPVVYDPVLQQYLEGVVGRLASKMSNVNFPFEIILVDDRTINAAAFFGGKMMINTGLIVASENESEVASVLAHEMTHVTQRHLARSIEAQNKNLVPGILGIVGGLILSVINPALGGAAIVSTVGGMSQSSVNYTRDHEYEADRLGIDLLYQAGYNPEGMADMMRILSIGGDYINPAFEMLLSHPINSKRVAEAENRARQYQRTKIYESVDYQFARARIISRFSNAGAKHNYSKAKLTLENNSNDVGSLYLLALSAMELEKYSEAEKALSKLKKMYPNSLFVIDSYTDLYIAQEQYNNAISMLKTYMTVFPHNEVITINLAYTYLSSNKYTQVEDVIKKSKRYSFSVLGDEFLLEAYRKQQKTCASYLINTELLEYKGMWKEALFSAKEAMRSCTEKNTLLKIQAQISRITQERDFYEQLLGK